MKIFCFALTAGLILFASELKAQSFCISPVTATSECIQDAPPCSVNKLSNSTEYVGGLAAICNQWADTEMKRIFLGEQLVFLDGQLAQLSSELKASNEENSKLKRLYRRARAHAKRRKSTFMSSLR